MPTKKQKANRKNWKKYLKNSRLTPEEQARRVNKFVREGRKPKW